MNCEILAVGTELLLGEIANTDAQMISLGLSELGINVYHHTVVGDNPARLSAALEKVNAAINVNVLFAYRLEFHPVQDEQTGEIAINPFLVDISDPESRVSVAELLALLGAIGL